MKISLIFIIADAVFCFAGKIDDPDSTSTKSALKELYDWLALMGDNALARLFIDWNPRSTLILLVLLEHALLAITEADGARKSKSQEFHTLSNLIAYFSLRAGLISIISRFYLSHVL